MNEYSEEEAQHNLEAAQKLAQDIAPDPEHDDPDIEDYSGSDSES